MVGHLVDDQSEHAIDATKPLRIEEKTIGNRTAKPAACQDAMFHQRIQLAGIRLFGVDNSRLVASRNLTSFELIFAAERGAQVKTTGENFQALLLNC